MTISAKGIAVVTGASSGIGAIYADRLARRGYDVILVARRRARLHEMAERLAEETGRTIKVVAADLGEEADLRRIETSLQNDASISVLVNIAGFGVVGPLLELNGDKVEDMIALNIRALTRLTRAVVPGLVARGRGTIINVASGVAIASETLRAVYSGTKALVLALSLLLHKALVDMDVRVQFLEIVGHPIDDLPGQIVMQAGDMIDATLADLDRDKLVTLPALSDARAKCEGQFSILATDRD